MRELAGGTAVALCVAWLTLASLASAGGTAADYKQAAGPFAVTVRSLDWRDGTRYRDVSAKMYCPAADRGPFPVIVFSPAQGDSRDACAYLGRHWASHGYVCFHVQHESAARALKGKGHSGKPSADVLSDAESLVDRPLDIRFALDQIAQMNKADKAVCGRLDLKRIGMAGHALGAYTALIMAGQVFIAPTQEEVSSADRRIKAVIAMSPPVPVRNRNDFDRVYGHVAIPGLHLTGLRDGAPSGGARPEDRRAPFDHIRAPGQYLVIFKDGDPMLYKGRRPAGQAARPNDARLCDLIRMSTTAFWDAHLKNDAAAQAWLNEGGIQQALGDDGTFEEK